MNRIMVTLNLDETQLEELRDILIEASLRCSAAGEIGEQLEHRIRRAPMTCNFDASNLRPAHFPEYCHCLGGRWCCKIHDKHLEPHVGCVLR
jgi:signal recognition particle GTPase